MFRTLATLTLTASFAAPAFAQDDRSAGLFTEARSLPLVSQAITVAIAGGEAELRVTQVFANDGDDLGQADYILYLPEGATVTGFGFWQGDKLLASTLKAKEEAEAAHDQAATEGRTTAIVKNERSIHSFSVYPVKAGELKQVETTIRMPAVMETGRSHLSIPIDRFLGQPKVSSTIAIRLASDSDIESWGLPGTKPIVLSSAKRVLELAASTDRALDFWWQESTEALDTRAERVELEPGSYAARIRLTLADASSWTAKYRELAIIVDGSFSMRRHQSAVAAAIARITERTTVPARVLVTTGHHATWASFAEARNTAGCSSEVRCIVLTDLSSDPDVLAKLGESELPALLIGDAHELAFTEGKRPNGSLVYQAGTDATARLESLADELVLPLMSLVSITQNGEALELTSGQPRRVAEGGMLAIFTRVAGDQPVQVILDIGDQKIERTMKPETLAPDTERGKRVRRGWYKTELARMMAAYRETPDDALKTRIVDLSVREGIPTAFTALQVDDPELSLYAIKPGDPLLTVHDEPGLEHVVAFYPFGESRKLAFDPETKRYTDRFLVPRGWGERSYRVDVFKHFADGSVKIEHTWYRIDERGPSAKLSFDDKRRVLRVDTGDATGDVASVIIQAKAKTIALSPVGTSWLAFADELPTELTIFVRDRAGNRTAFLCSLAGGRLEVLPEVRQTKSAPNLPRATMPNLERLKESTPESPARIAIDGRTATIRIQGKDLSFALDTTPLRSLKVSAATKLSDDTYLFGTESGDLVELSCAKECSAKLIGAPELEHYSIRGLTKLPNNTILVGTLGRGLYELSQGKVKRSRLDVGSKFITALDGNRIITAYNGVWRVDPKKNRVIKTLEATPAPKATDVGSPSYTALAEHAGKVYAAGFDRGLFELTPDGTKSIALALSPIEKQINALASFDGRLYLGTEAGLFSVDPSDPMTLARVLDGATHDLALSPHALAAATSRGLWIIAKKTAPRRADGQGAPGTGKFFTAAWHGGALFAGDMEGLYRFEADCVDRIEGIQIGAAEGFDANWVTALLSDGDRLVIGTYDAGVYTLANNGRAAKVKGLEAQWVPPHAIRAIDGELWIGGLGMRPAKIDRTKRVTALDVPMRDTNDFLARGADVLIATSDGVVRIVADKSAKR